MGYMRHHAIVVTSYADHILEAHDEALRVFGTEQVSEMTAEVVNGYRTFVVGPDGSKEGWEPSAQGDARRAAFIEWLNAQAWADGSNSLHWVEVQYGDDNGDTRVCASDEDHFNAVHKLEEAES